jgi:hypothetical protein
LKLEKEMEEAKETSFGFAKSHYLMVKTKLSKQRGWGIELYT